MPGTVWTKFYWNDWLSDPGLRRSSMMARGLWIDLLCFMAQHDPIGILAVEGEALSISDIARMTGIMETDASTLLGELERNGVFSRDRKGRIYSRRMVRDAKKSAEGRKNKLEALSAKPRENKEKKTDLEGGLKADLQAQEPRANNQKKEREEKEAEPPPILRERELVDAPAHRSLIADLRSRGEKLLTDWEKQFLGSIYGLKNLTRKQREQFDVIRQKVGEMADESEDREWTKKLVFARQHRQWGVEDWGPMPGKSGCRVPAHLLQPGDGDGWTEWRAAS